MHGLLENGLNYCDVMENRMVSSRSEPVGLSLPKGQTSM